MERKYKKCFSKNTINVMHVKSKAFHGSHVDYDVIYPYKPTSAILNFKNFVEYWNMVNMFKK